MINMLPAFIIVGGALLWKTRKNKRLADAVKWFYEQKNSERR